MRDVTTLEWINEKIFETVEEQIQNLRNFNRSLNCHFENKDIECEFKIYDRNTVLQHRRPNCTTLKTTLQPYTSSWDLSDENSDLYTSNNLQTISLNINVKLEVKNENHENSQRCHLHDESENCVSKLQNEKLQQCFSVFPVTSIGLMNSVNECFDFIKECDEWFCDEMQEC